MKKFILVHLMKGRKNMGTSSEQRRFLAGNSQNRFCLVPFGYGNYRGVQSLLRR